LQTANRLEENGILLYLRNDLQLEVAFLGEGPTPLECPGGDVYDQISLLDDVAVFVN
jgi:hypothetical protein